jgi:hypothetical protein
MGDKTVPEQACQHEWHCPGALQVAAEGKLVILLPLFCRLCAEVRTTIAPPPEQSRVERAQVLPVEVAAASAIPRDR